MRDVPNVIGLSIISNGVMLCTVAQDKTNISKHVSVLEDRWLGKRLWWSQSGHCADGNRAECQTEENLRVCSQVFL